MIESQSAFRSLFWFCAGYMKDEFAPKVYAYLCAQKREKNPVDFLYEIAPKDVADTDYKPNQDPANITPVGDITEFTSLEAFEAAEKALGDKGMSYYYLLSNVPDTYEVVYIFRQEDRCLKIYYRLKEPAEEFLDPRETEYLRGFMISMSLTPQSDPYLKMGSKEREASLKEGGIKELQYKGNTFYCKEVYKYEEYEIKLHDHLDQRFLGYDLSVYRDVIRLNYQPPGIETLEDLMKYTELTKVFLK
jgi:hypothetical protein